MSKENLKPYDIISAKPFGLGVVMRNDPDSGLLVAFPGMDEIMDAKAEEMIFEGNLAEVLKRQKC